ncbi:MAG TPA: protein kinase, partial [Gemmataceae bacterium]
MTAQHPDWDELLAYGQGCLDPSSAQSVEKHLADCRQCCELLETAPADSFLDRLRDAGTSDSGPGDQPIPRELIDHPRYRVLGLVGEGGMGAVYRAVHRRMERVVALKVMRPSLMRHPSAVQRFHQEARAAARLHHPHIVTAHDADQAGDLHFLVMEHVEGRNLADYLRENGPLPVAEACRYVRQAALGLQHAHEQGMVHRDIKPHNLMLQTTGDPAGSLIKILDFGLARLPRTVEAPPSAGLSYGSLTATGTVMGTADYIAPEQAADPRTADIRADIYALGCTLFHLLCGRPPFPEGTVAEKLAHHAESPLPSPHGNVPVELVAVLKRMTAKDPARRYATPAETAEALAPFCGANNRLLRPKGRRRRWLLATVTLSAAGLFAGWFVWHRAEDNPPRKDDNSPAFVEKPKPHTSEPTNSRVPPAPEFPGPDVPADLDDDPAEQAAIEVIKKHGGFVTQDSKQPGNPVIAVTVFQPSFTDNDLKSLAGLTKVRKMNLANTKITGVGFKDLTGLKDLTELQVSQTPLSDEGLKAI